MPQIKRRSILSGIRVETAMRRQVVSAGALRSLDYCINRMVKYKVGALLITDDGGHPLGIVSKTDLISAYYAMLPREMAAGDLVAAEPITCYPDDMLEDAIELMHGNGIHRVYVRGAELGTVTGTLAYIDVVGLLYKYCRTCQKSTAKTRTADHPAGAQRLLVSDVMSPSVVACDRTTNLAEVIEVLTTHNCGAVLIADPDGRAAGVISKSDLVLAYRHGLPIETPADAIMHSPALTCSATATLSAALQEMLVLDIQRLFVYGENTDRIVGVLSLSDSARFRSGSCRACVSGRLLVE
jgi:CBS domain-containing protein